MKHALRKTGLGLGLLALIGTANVRPAHAISDQQEIEAGRQMAQQAIKEYGQPLPANDPRQQRVSRIGAMFARQAQRRNIPFSYTVLQNDKVLNAFAGPGGPVFVTTKLIATAQNDAELAYVLGHETGHIEYRHVVQSAQKAQTLGIGAAILGSILGRRAGNAGAIVGGLVNVGAGLWQKGFSRKEESQADDYGVHAMARLGFDPRAAISMLGRLGNGPEGLAKYLSDHPTGLARQHQVQAAIDNDRLLAVAQANGGPFLSLNGSREVSVYGNTNNGNLYQAGRAAPFNGRVVNGVVVAPVIALAQLAGGQYRQNGDTVEVRGGGTSGSFGRGQTQAQLGGRTIVMQAAPQRIGGQLFAPLGALTNALGGRVALNEGANTATLTWSDGRTNILRF